MTCETPFGRAARVVQFRFNVNFEMSKPMGRIDVVLEAPHAGKERVRGQNPFRRHFVKFRRPQRFFGADNGRVEVPSPGQGLARDERMKKFPLQGFEVRLTIIVLGSEPARSGQ